MNNRAHAFVAITIKHPNFNSAIEAIRRTHSMFGSVGTGMLFLGPTGVGKSTVITTVIREYNKTITDLETEELTKHPILKVSVPSKPTIKGLIEKLLIAAEHPIITGTQSKLEARLSAVIRNQGVEMIIFDEFQHMLRDQAQISTRNVLNFIKVLMDDHKLAIVMCGIPEAKNAISQYEELYQRFCYEHFYLPPFSLATDIDTEYFKGFLVTIENILQDLDVKCLPLSEPDMMKRILLATEGRARLINRLILKAIDASTDPNRLMMMDFSAALNTSGFSMKLGIFNPFVAKMQQVEKRLEAGI